MSSLTRTLFPLIFLLTALSRVAAAQTMELPEPVGMDGDPAARMVLDGNSAFLRGDLRVAARDYQAALHRKPDFAVATFDLGLVEVHEGDRSRGLADMDRGIALASRNGMNSSYIARLRALRNAFTVERATT